MNIINHMTAHWLNNQSLNDSDSDGEYTTSWKKVGDLYSFNDIHDCVAIGDKSGA